MDFRSFYSVDWVSRALLKQFKGRYVNIRFSFGMRRHYNSNEITRLKKLGVELLDDRPDPFFEIRSIGDPTSPVDLLYFVSIGAVEFIPEVSLIHDLNRTDSIIIDLDPKNKEYPFDTLRDRTLDVLESLLNFKYTGFSIQAYKVRFSGNRSFHLYFKLDGLYEFELLRGEVKKALDPLCEGTDLSYKNIRDKDDYVLIDIGALARHRCVRSLWSMHYKTGLVCVPCQDIVTFDKASCSIDAVFSNGPINEVF